MPRRQNLRSLIAVLPRIWNQPDVHGRIIDGGRFQFIFPTEESMETVLRRGPWAFAERMVVLQRWTPYMMPDLLNFIPFWIQIRGIPLQYMNQDVIAHIGRAMGLLMDIDYNAEAIARVEYARVEYARVRLNLDVTQPLRFQKNFQFTQGFNTLLRFRYERLRGFCEVCGILTHDSGACLIPNGDPVPHSDDENDEDENNGEEHQISRGIANGVRHHGTPRQNAAGSQEQSEGVRIEEVVDAEDLDSDEEEDQEADGKLCEAMVETVPTIARLKRKLEDTEPDVDHLQRMITGESSGSNKKKMGETGRVCGEVGPEPPLPP
uniref:DUF4283 domain-containing protein n=1 Tax=Noccaea caerulescens TaxID=107243 RepID=A0A1J3K5X0_NOCCA